MHWRGRARVSLLSQSSSRELQTVVDCNIRVGGRACGLWESRGLKRRRAARRCLLRCFLWRG